MFTFVTMKIKDRISTLMEDQGWNRAALAQHLGMQPSAISHVLNGRNRPSLDMLTKFKSSIPTLDLNWLLTGLGTPYLNEYSNDVPESTEKQQVNVEDYEPQEKYSSPSPKDVVRSQKRLKRVLLLYSDGSVEEYDPSLGE